MITKQILIIIIIIIFSFNCIESRKKSSNNVKELNEYKPIKDKYQKERKEFSRIIHKKKGIKLNIKGWLNIRNNSKNYVAVIGAKNHLKLINFDDRYIFFLKKSEEKIEIISHDKLRPNCVESFEKIDINEDGNNDLYIFLKYNGDEYEGFDHKKKYNKYRLKYEKYRGDGIRIYLWKNGKYKKVLSLVVKGRSSTFKVQNGIVKISTYDPMLSVLKYSDKTAKKIVKYIWNKKLGKFKKVIIKQ